MFKTLEVCNVHCAIHGYLKESMYSIDMQDYETAQNALGRAQAIMEIEFAGLDTSCSDEIVNEFYLLNTLVSLISNYVTFWKNLSISKFAESWATLQNVQDYLRILKRFIHSNQPKLLSYLEQQCEQLEKLYPYQVFFSTGFVASRERQPCFLARVGL